MTVLFLAKFVATAVCLFIEASVQNITNWPGNAARSDWNQNKKNFAKFLTEKFMDKNLKHPSSMAKIKVKFTCQIELAL